VATFLSLAPVVIAFALRREAMYFRRRLHPRQPIPQAPCPALRSGPLVILETGMGQAAARRALEWAQSTTGRPRLVVSVGFSGALCWDLAVGDLVVATEVVDIEGHAWPATWPEAPPAATALKKGRLLCVPELVSDPTEKRRLADQYRALAVDMESAALAQLCHARAIPFACLRSISDDARTGLSPRLAGLLRGGRVAGLPLVVAIARSPTIVPELFRLARDTRKAARVLALGLENLLVIERTDQAG
jgi:adenosylhomocysteine nucleosidase